MHQLFIIKLYKKHKLFLIFVLLFVFVYAVVLFKNMDMLFFPMNSMFSENKAVNFNASTSAMKVNGNIISITTDPYLKKDFSESSLLYFSNWLINNKNNFITTFLHRRITDSTNRHFFLQKLTPPATTETSFPLWFAQYHNIDLQPVNNFEIWSYQFVLQSGQYRLADSTLHWKKTINK